MSAHEFLEILILFMKAHSPWFSLGNLVFSNLRHDQSLQLRGDRHGERQEPVAAREGRHGCPVGEEAPVWDRAAAG